MAQGSICSKETLRSRPTLMSAPAPPCMDPSGSWQAVWSKTEMPAAAAARQSSAGVHGHLRQREGARFVCCSRSAWTQAAAWPRDCRTACMQDEGRAGAAAGASSPAAMAWPPLLSGSPPGRWEVSGPELCRLLLAVVAWQAARVQGRRLAPIRPLAEEPEVVCREQQALHNERAANYLTGCPHSGALVSK